MTLRNSLKNSSSIVRKSSTKQKLRTKKCPKIYTKSNKIKSKSVKNLKTNKLRPKDKKLSFRKGGMLASNRTLASRGIQQLMMMFKRPAASAALREESVPTAASPAVESLSPREASVPTAAPPAVASLSLREAALQEASRAAPSAEAYIKQLEDIIQQDTHLFNSINREYIYYQHDEDFNNEDGIPHYPKFGNDKFHITPSWKDLIGINLRNSKDVYDQYNKKIASIREKLQERLRLKMN